MSIIALNPSGLKGGSGSAPRLKINATINDKLMFSDFNVPEKIVVPSEAMSHA